MQSYFSRFKTLEIDSPGFAATWSHQGSKLPICLCFAWHASVLKITSSQDGSRSSSLCLPFAGNRKKNENHTPAGSAFFKEPSQQFHSTFRLRFIVHNLVLWPHLVAMYSFNWVSFCPQRGILLLRKTKEEIVRRQPVITVDLQKLLYPFYPIPSSQVITQSGNPFCKVVFSMSTTQGISPRSLLLPTWTST